jgi:hypothetical protein
MLIAFTDGPKPVLQHIARKSSALNQASARDVRKLKQGDAPVRWWYITETRSRDGAETDTLDMTFGAPVLRIASPSLISTQAVRAITTATVIVDVGAAEGLPLKSVVDYAALVALAEIKGDASPSGSILSLFDRAGAPRELTRRDSGFLSGLYSIHMDRRADQQRRTLVGQMVRQAAAN